MARGDPPTETGSTARTPQASPGRLSLRARGPWQQQLWVGALLLFAVTLQALFLLNMVRWLEAPDRGWIYLTQLGPTIVWQTRPLGAEAGLRKGDEILAINGRSYQTVDELLGLLDLELGRPNHYRIRRGDRELDVTVVTRPLGLSRVAAQSGVFWLLGTAFVALGVLVFAMKPYDGPSLAFLNLSTGLGLMVTYFAPSSRFEPAWLDRVALLVVPLLPASLLHLAALFPRRRPALARGRWLAPPYVLSFVLAAVSLLLAPKAADVPKPLLTAIYLYLLLALLAFLASTHRTYWKGTSSAERLQALVILTGLAIAFIAPTLELVSNLTLRISFFPNPMIFFLLFLLCFPLSIGYAIVQHDLFEIDVIVRRTYGYILTTGLIVGLYGATVLLLNLLLGPSEIARSPFFVIGFVLVVLVLLQPLQGRIQRLVDRAFFRARFDYQKTIAQVADRMTSLLEPVLVRQTLLHAVVDEMFLENGILLAPAGAGGGSFSVSSRLGEGGPDAEAELDPALVERLRAEPQPVFRHEVDLAPRYASVRERLRANLDALAAELVIPMLYQGSLRGVLALGRKKSGRMFTREDVVLLRTVAAQGSVALENARLFDDLAESLKQVQLLETVKGALARFVPQTVQQLIEKSPDVGEIFEKRERDLTVMFADMTGYTRLSSQLPLDEVNGIVERYFGAFLEEILAQGGDVNETAGDGLMVLFQHDDPREHARAAVRAAAGIQRITRSLNAERVGAIPIGVHIGINSGIASVGATKIQAGAGMRWTYTASGSTTNTAARIGALGHEIAITGETRSRLAGGFALEDLGEQALKNVARPVRVFRVQTPEAPSAAAAPARAAPVASGELGGRGVRGVLREAGSGRPLAGYRIRVFDKDLIRDDFLGEALCDGEGRFQLRFAPGSSPGLLEGHLDLYLRVIDPQVEREVWSTATEIRKAELDVETFEVEVPPHRLV